MTENLAARGEGLAGLVAEIKGIADAIFTTNAYRGRQLHRVGEKLLALAAAPAGTAHANEHELLVGGIVRAALELAILRGDLRMDSGDAFEEMSDSEREDVITDTWNAMNGEGTCDDEPVKELTAIYAALATPSPQTPVTPVNSELALAHSAFKEPYLQANFSTTSAREQSPATAANNPSTGDMRAILDHCWRIIEETQQDTGRFGAIRGSARKIMSFGLPGNNPLRIVEVTPLTEDTKLWLNGKKVPAATQEQEQPAGSEASENDLWLELAKILRFEKGDDGDWFIPAEPQPLGPFFSILQAAIAFMRFMDATDKAMREEIEQLRVGSPRKVGEDGAQTFEQWWQAEGVHMVRTTHRTGYELMKEAWNAARSSSVPVGEQKQEEGV